MLNLRTISVSVSMLTLCAALASAAPISFDGNIVPGEGYLYRLEDGNSPADTETPMNSDWDIDAVTLAIDVPNGWAYVGLDVMGTFDRNGSGTTPWSKSTVFTGQFITPTADRIFEFTSTATTQKLTVDGAVVPVGDWDAAYGTDLELKIKLSYVATIASPVFDFFGGLDDRGTSEDDYLTASVAPEPGTVALLALGGIAALLRRRGK
jgi:hypothetical protein